MTNEEMIEDLKQFIATTVSQEAGGLRDELKSEIKVLDKKLGVIQDAIADTFTHTAETTETTLQDYDQRIRRLERHAA